MAQPPETYPRQETMDAVGLLREIRYSLVPGKKEAFVALFADFGKGATTDVQQVMARARQLLEGHPHLVARFYGLVTPELQAMHFLQRAKEALGGEDYDKFLARLYFVDEERSLNAHQVYQEFKNLLGEKHGDLLRDLADFLPTKYGPPPPCAEAPREEPRRKPKPKRAKSPPDASNAVVADEPESSRTRGAKKPRVDGGGLAPEPACNVADAAGGSRPNRVRKPRADGRHAPTGGGAVKSLGRVAAAPDTDDDEVAEVKRFRKAWEFETGYSALCATLKCALRVQPARARRSLEQLFPSRVAREYLAKMYHSRWADMRALLERGGRYTDVALELIVDRLKGKDAAAVDEARRRRDPARAAERLEELVRDRVLRKVNEERRSP